MIEASERSCSYRLLGLLAVLLCHPGARAHHAGLMPRENPPLPFILKAPLRLGRGGFVGWHLSHDAQASLAHYAKRS